MDQNNFNNNKNTFSNDNPTERPGYYTSQTDSPRMMYPKFEEPQKPVKSRMGLGILIGIIVMAVAMMLVFFVTGFFNRIYGLGNNTLAIGSGSVSKEAPAYEQKIELIQQYLDAYYMGEYSESDMEHAIAKGFLSGIGDKYAQYYDPKEYQSLLEDISGNYAGIGVSITQNDNGTIEIYKVFKGTPADEAGVLPGDLIIEAAGEKIFETLDDLVAVVRGEPGTTVDIVVYRDGKEIPFTIERKQIAIPTIEYKMLDNQIGYIQIAQFEIVTVEQFNEALDVLEKEGMTSLILDLRDNPGGDYDSVVAMADRVLPEGVIISTKDKNGTVKSENSDEAHKLTIPCAAIVNGNSASASELFVGALQDYGVATIVGTTTYGKGVVQSIFALSDGSGMKFTTETYYTPKGRDINGIGIEPDVEVELPDDVYDDNVLDEEEDTQLQKAIEILTVN